METKSIEKWNVFFFLNFHFEQDNHTANIFIQINIFFLIIEKQFVSSKHVRMIYYEKLD